MIIGLINQKGGVGKTTLSLNVAHALSKKTDSSNVLVVDVDPQQSSLAWSEVRESPPPFHVIGFAKKSIHRDLPSIAERYDYVVVDSPPRVAELARACIMVSDIIIVPCTPSPYDVWASSETLHLMEEASIYKKSLKGAFVMNRVIANTTIGREVVDALNEMALPVLNSKISQRVIFAESASRGLTVFDVEPEGKAVKEIINLVDEIVKL